MADFHCKLCSLKFKRECDYETHLHSDGHKLTAIEFIDKDHAWAFRCPPIGTPDHYCICKSNQLAKCRWGDQCPEAHSMEELNEWIERFEYRKAKLDEILLSDFNDYSFIDNLQKELEDGPPEIIAHELIDVSIRISPESKVVCYTKNCCCEWLLNVKSKRRIMKMALLHDESRSNYSLHSISMNGVLELLEIGCQQKHFHFHEKSSAKEFNYEIKIGFKGQTFGIFNQQLILDFGDRPLLSKSFSVEVFSRSDADILAKAKECIDFNDKRWSDKRYQIIRLDRPAEESFSHIDYNLDQHNLNLNNWMSNENINERNYSKLLHELLYIEEITQLALVSKFNISCEINVISDYCIAGISVLKNSREGQNFGLINLGSYISEDSPHGRLLLNNSNSIYLLPKYNPSGETSTIFECSIEDKSGSQIYINLPEICVKQLKLKNNDKIKAQIQFQLNRTYLCSLHWAVDKISILSRLFPPSKTAHKLKWNPSKQWNKMSTKLNAKQKEAIIAIKSPLENMLPPIVISGPFGTGKTFTLAESLKHLLSQDASNKILICTHSNSAADLYAYFLKQYIEEGHLDAAPLRIHYTERRIATVPEDLLEFCLTKITDQGTKFRNPNKEEVNNHRVVITTLAQSIILSKIEVQPGSFTHILIDEAAQATECEILIPLALADLKTRVVLAGDHMQICPEIFSSLAIKKELNRSLLDRLYDLYDADHPCKIMLIENYRSHKAIVEFASELFYNNKLVGSANIHPHPLTYPLSFSAARGEDVQAPNSSYYNLAEVGEIVEVVKEIVTNWPVKLWGDINMSKIGVVTPYYDQVILIRSALRKNKLKGVSVERVHNVQGKQFRVVILSTVRTKKTMGEHVNKESEDLINYGFFSDSKLLNTALTRAQSLVIVVGDPVALCSIGKCKKIWERYISNCKKNRSFSGMSFTSMKYLIEGVLLKKSYPLNPCAPVFIPRYYMPPNFSPSMTTHSPFFVNLVGNPIYQMPPTMPAPFPSPMVDINMLTNQRIHEIRSSWLSWLHQQIQLYQTWDMTVQQLFHSRGIIPNTVNFNNYVGPPVPTFNIHNVAWPNLIHQNGTSTTSTASQSPQIDSNIKSTPCTSPIENQNENKSERKESIQSAKLPPVESKQLNTLMDRLMLFNGESETFKSNNISDPSPSWQNLTREIKQEINSSSGRKSSNLPKASIKSYASMLKK